MVQEICSKAWLVQSYDSKKDTPQTVDEARANNRARAAFCKK